MVKNKKAALELSIGTIVILVLAMSMLILGLVLVRSIFTGAKYNVDQMNNKVRDEINKLFVEGKKIVVYLPNQKADIKQGADWGVAFALKNLETGNSQGGTFRYTVATEDTTLGTKCGISTVEVNRDWLVTGSTDTLKIAPGDTYYNIVRLKIPEGAPLCTIRFKIMVDKTQPTNVQGWANDFFDLEVLPK